MEYPLGVIPDIKDDRDFKISKYLAKDIELPRKLDRTCDNLPVRNQGRKGSCVAFGAAGAKESQEGGGYLSPDFLYKRIALDGGGAHPRDVMKLLVDVGVPPESCCPYRDEGEGLFSPECKDALVLAKQNKIKAYARLVFLDEMKLCLNQNGCFACAVGVTENWQSPTSDGLIIETGDIIGHHQVEFVGYDDDLTRIKFRNSWGEDWGENGYGYLSYDYFMKILDDAWSFVDIPESEETKPTPEPSPEPTPVPVPDPSPDPVPPNPGPAPTPKSNVFYYVAIIITIILGYLTIR